MSPLAEEDLEAIYKYTVLNHGLDQLDIYAGRIDAAIAEIAEDSMRTRSRRRDDLFTGCRFYSVEHHFLVYRVKDGCVEIGRVLHEAMDFSAHVSEDEFPATISSISSRFASSPVAVASSRQA